MGFDWAKINGYREDMTADEKLALLESFEEPAAEKTVSKELFDNAASKLAAEKKARAAAEQALKDRMSEEERKEAERQTAEQELRAELETLRKERAHAGYKGSLLEAGYGADDAEAMAKAASEGDFAQLFSALSKANDAFKKTIRAEVMKGTVRPDAGESNKPTDTATEFALGIAKGVAESNKAAGDVLSHYI